MSDKHVTPDEVLHTEMGQRGMFFVERGGHRVAELTYTIAGDNALVDHTYVEPSMRGGNLAPSLVDAAVRWARGENRKILPLCSYVRSVFNRNRSYDDVRA
jgi:predicted GNAT family acetyltransferase